MLAGVQALLAKLGNNERIRFEKTAAEGVRRGLAEAVDEGGARVCG